MLNKSVLIGVLALAASAVTANAGVILENGGFESYTGGSPAPSQLGSGAGYTKITDWTLSPSNGYAFLFGSGTATTTGSYSPEFTTAVKLWGPGDGSANGLPASSPAGGNYVAGDPVYKVPTVSQTLTGFNVGETVKVTFYYATAEQYLHTTTTPIKGGWDVTLGSESRDTPLLQIGNKGFNGWDEITETFTAQAASEILSFTAIGTGTAADPPFALLDGVSISVPEPATWAMMILGVMGVGCAARMRRQETVIPA